MIQVRAMAMLAVLALGAPVTARATTFVFDISMTSQQTCDAVNCTPDAGFTPYSSKLSVTFAPARRLDNTTTNLDHEILRIVSILGPALGGPPDADLLAISGLDAGDVRYRVFATQVDIGVPRSRGESQVFISSNGVRVFDTPEGVVKQNGYAFGLSTPSVPEAFLPYAGLKTAKDLYRMLVGLDASGGFNVHGDATLDDYAYDLDTGEILRNDSRYISRSGTARLNQAESVVPEPGAWALMILGFGATGAALRARRGVRSA